MGTRSAIIVKTGKKEYKAIYCHWDGYPSHVGRILHEHYNTQEKAETLIALGDISALYENIAPPEGKTHDFDHPCEGVTIAYGRDRGETGVEAKVAHNVKWVKSRIDHAYFYVFKDGQWLVNGRTTVPNAIKREED